MYEYTAKLIRVVDADTFKLEVDLGFRVSVRETFRLARLNAPPLLSVEGVKAKLYVEQHLTKASALKVVSSRSEKYGRWLCELYFQTTSPRGEWHHLNQLLLDSRHAVPFRH